MFTIQVTDKTFYQAYLQILNGILKLTRMEIFVLAQFMNLKDALDGTDLDPAYKERILFSSENRKIVKENLKITEQNLNNYIKSLKDKKVILYELGYYKITPKIYIRKSQNNVQFKFKIQGS